jgi:adenosine deaminase
MDPPMTVGRSLTELPKAHLHIHLEGAMRPATLQALAAARGIEVPPVRDFTGFAAFADLYVAACTVVGGEAGLRRLAREIVEDAAADGVVWIEPAFYCPRYRSVIGSDAAVIEIVLDELAVAGAELGLGAGLIVSADRTADPAEAVELARVAARFAGRGVVGFGLANDEAGRPPEPFAEAFALARDAGLLSVPHGGELAGPESVRGCLDACRAHRVMHGIRAVEDPRLVDRLVEEGIYLDVCPSSNLALSVVPSIAAHPLRALIDAGVRCTLNADDPLLFGPGIAEEYRLGREELGLDDATLAQVARWSLDGSGAPADVIAAAHTAIDA